MTLSTPSALTKHLLSSCKPPRAKGVALAPEASWHLQAAAASAFYGTVATMSAKWADTYILHWDFMDGNGNFLYVKVNWHLGLLEDGVSSLPGGVGQYIHCGILAGVETHKSRKNIYTY